MLFSAVEQGEVGVSFKLSFSKEERCPDVWRREGRLGGIEETEGRESDSTVYSIDTQPRRISKNR